MTAAVFDELIHPPNRLRICATLAAVETLAFATVRETVDVSESVLSKQVKVLQAAGYVTVTKTRRQAHRRTWLALTPRGREAFAGHLAELHRLAGLVDAYDG